MTCKHENAGEICHRRTWAVDRVVEVRRGICFDCAAWLGMGESADDSDAVRIEMRAAELAARRGFGSFSNCGAGCERCGYVAAEHESSAAPDGSHKLAQFHAGYLAHAIVTHDEAR